MRKNRMDRGFVSKIILIIIALVAIKYYYHFDIIEWIKSDQGQKIIDPLVTFSKNAYAFIDNLVKGWTT